MAVFFVILIAIAIALVVVGVGIAVGAIAAVALVILVSAGILSSSLIVGFKTGSASKGVRLAIFQICAALGAAAGLAIAAAIKLFAEVRFGWIPVEALGLFTGVCTGMVVGASISSLLKFILQKWGSHRGFDVLPVAERSPKTVD